MSPEDAKRLAAEFIDAAPEDAMSVEEYVWSYQMLSRQDLVDTGMLEDFAEHARNIQLDPAKSDLSRPVVVSMGDGERYRVAVWDGVHRIMSALDLGHEKLPAVVGIRKGVTPNHQTPTRGSAPLGGLRIGRTKADSRPVRDAVKVMLLTEGA